MRINIESLCVDEGVVWYTTLMNALIGENINRRDREIYPFDANRIQGGICSVIKVAGYVYLVPRRGSRIIVFDTASKEFHYELYKIGKENELIHRAFYYDERIYIFFEMVGVCAIVDLKTCATRIVDFTKMIVEKLGRTCLYYSPVYRCDDTLIGSLYEMNAFFAFDLDCETFSIIKVENMDFGIFASYAILNDYLFAYDKINKKLCRYSYDSFSFVDGFDLDKRKDWRIIAGKDSIIVDSIYTNDYILVRGDMSIVEKGQIKSAHLPEELTDLIGLVDASGSYYYNKLERSLYMINDLSAPIKSFDGELDYNWVEHGGVFIERPDLDLKDFILCCNS